MTLATWLAFFAACWAISVSPGAGALAAMTSGLNHGLRRGLITVPGLILGIWTQLLIVGVGLGALVAASPTAFEVVRWSGVAYLVYLGIQQWRAPPRDWSTQTEAGHTSARTLILRGWAVNAVNPKGTVFFLAMVPQFINLQAELLPQYLVIGLTLSFTDLVVMTGYTALAARVLRVLKSPEQQRLLNHGFGALFVCAGLLLALFQR
ncbi:MAG: threonine transporter RhtB [Betaproteobacteria bacterium]|jgi:homoserine/homoserine lactone efflux protein|nr:threonine transporter RhtB [Betaproteobacteria bacterium]NBT10768.1 threonine transporter RhtB [Betaproteobacteria bacterium]NBU49121.1 threonine transporter RhtB [Betaproteobacteria bacterium]NBX95973.1 threonine transporter RhtB [Betaproteobacteria bacterium]